MTLENFVSIKVTLAVLTYFRVSQKEVSLISIQCTFQNPKHSMPHFRTQNIQCTFQNPKLSGPWVDANRDLKCLILFIMPVRLNLQCLSCGCLLYQSLNSQHRSSFNDDSNFFFTITIILTIFIKLQSKALFLNFLDYLDLINHKSQTKVLKIDVYSRVYVSCTYNNLLLQSIVGYRYYCYWCFRYESTNFRLYLMW